MKLLVGDSVPWILGSRRAVLRVSQEWWRFHRRRWGRADQNWDNPLLGQIEIRYQIIGWKHIISQRNRAALSSHRERDCDWSFRHSQNETNNPNLPSALEKILRWPEIWEPSQSQELKLYCSLISPGKLACPRTRVSRETFYILEMSLK